MTDLESMKSQRVHSSSRRQWLMDLGLYPNSVFIVFFLAILGWMGGFWLTRLGADHLIAGAAPSFDDPSVWYHIWTVMIAMSAAYWVAIIPLLTFWLLRLSREFPPSIVRLRWFAFLGAAAFALLLIVVLPLELVPEVDLRIPNHHFRDMAITAVGIAAGAPAVLGILWVNLAANDQSHWEEGTPDSVYVSRLVELRDNLQRFLLALGLTVGTAILTAGVLRQAILALHAQDVQDGTFAYPPALVVIYGLVFTFVMVLVYVPAHSALLNRGRELAERTFPVDSEMNAPAVLHQISERDGLVNHLRLGTGVLGDVKNALVIFAPVLAGLPSMLLR
jgi:hypothetical protein